MLLASVLGLFALLLYRLGWFAPLTRHRTLQRFEAEVGGLIDEVTWEDRMARFRQTHPRHAPRPRLSFRQ